MYHPLSGSQSARQAMERFLKTTWGPAAKQPPLNTLQHSLNGFQQCESFICETPKEIASSCHCKRGNLRHAQCNYSHWELPKTTRVAPHCCEEKKKSVEYLLLCVARTLMSHLLRAQPFPTVPPLPASQALQVPQESTDQAGGRGEPCQAATSYLTARCGSTERFGRSKFHL